MIRCDVGKATSLREFSALGFDWRILTGMLVQALVLVVVGMGAQQIVIAPFLYRAGRATAKAHTNGDLVALRQRDILDEQPPVKAQGRER